MVDRAKADTNAELTLDAQAVRRLCGDVLDATVAAIVESGASVADLELALAWRDGLSGARSETGQPLSGAAAQVYDLLIAEQDAADER
jgi:hypothetical protein